MKLPRLYGKPRIKSGLRRTRKCDRCGEEKTTIEVFYFRDGVHPLHQDYRLGDCKVDRCWVCHVGRGVENKELARHRRRIAGRTHRPQADKFGAKIRNRQCDNPKCERPKWVTWEIPEHPRPEVDVTLCHCGGYMKVKR